MTALVSSVQRLKVHSSPSVIMAAGLVLLACLGPLMAPFDPNAQNLMRTLSAPDSSHWLGTDHVGRDVLSRVMAGAPASLGLAVFCVALAATIGIVLGLIAALRGRIAEAVIMRAADLVLAFPGLLLALLLAGFMGGGILPLLLGLKLTLWPQFARMTRAVASSTLREAHVEAAVLAGFPQSVVLLHNVLPSVLRQVMPLAALGLGSAIMTIASLGFLGLGLQPPQAEWGAMISELLPYMNDAPVQMAAPCVMIFLSVLTASRLGNRLTETAGEQT
ncbi:MAG: ABC transporter permease [Beijerinckiaceae bacterium]